MTGGSSVTEVTVQGVAQQGLPGFRRVATVALLFVLVAAPLLLPLAVTRLAPDELTLRALGHTLILTHVRHGAAGRLTLLVGALFCVAMAEWLVVGWQDSSLRRVLRGASPSVRSDIVVFLTQHCRIGALLQLVSTVGLVALVTRWVGHGPLVQPVHALGLSHWPAWAQLGTCFSLYTFGDYWAHRLSHTPLFWPLHRFHHAAEEFCILTHARIHATDVIGLIIVTLPILMLSPSADVLTLLWSTIAYQRMAIHSRVPWGLGWLGATLVQSPAHHRLHHLQTTGKGVTNFSLCPLWDHLFGTWRAEVPSEFAIGVDYPYRHGAWFLVDFMRDYLDFVLGLAMRILALRQTGVATLKR